MELARTLLEAVPGCRAEARRTPGGPRIEVAPESIVEVLKTVRDHPSLGYEALIDVTAADHVATEGVFHVVYVLRSYVRPGEPLIVKAKVDGRDPRIETVTSLWPGANWPEREVWDMFGIRFTGHPNLRRIMMYEEFEGHPLRKSYPVSKRQPLVEERDPIANPWPSRDRY